MPSRARLAGPHALGYHPRALDERTMAIAWVPAGEAPPCPLCAGGELAEWRVAASTALAVRPWVTFARCRSCGSLFDPDFSPAGAALPARMLEYYLEQGAGIEVMVAPLLRVPRDSVRRYLEVGCGYGFALDFARRELGWNGLGVDPSPLARAGARELGLEILDGLLDDSSAPPGAPFDLVYASEVVEHVAQPLAFLRTLRRVLSPDGLLALTTPDASAVEPRAPEDVLLRLLSPAHHAILYTAGTLERVLREAGFAAARVEPAAGTLRAFAGSAAALERVGPSGAAGDAVRRYLRGRAGGVRRGSALASGLAYRRFKADVQTGDHVAAAASERELRAALRARHRVDLGDPSRAADLRPGLAAAGPFPFNLPNALHYCGVHALNAVGDARRALACFAAGAELARRVLREELGFGIGDGETAELLRESRRHLPVVRARLEGPPALDALHELERGRAGEPPGFAPRPSQLRRTRLQVFLELVHRGDHAAAGEIEAAVGADAGAIGATGEDADLVAPVAHALGMSRLAAGEPEAAAAHFARAWALARGAAPGSAAAGLRWDARFHEAEALRRAGRPGSAAAIARELVALAAVPVPPALAARAAALAAGVAAPATAAGSPPRLVFGIDAYWRDAAGVYLRGWAHAGELPVCRLRLEAGARSAASETFTDRPDVLTHYPAHAHVRRCGFALYLATAAGAPLTLVAETAAGEVAAELDLPDHPLPPFPASPREEGLPRLVRQFVAAADAFGPGSTVLEIGVRAPSRVAIPEDVALRRAAYRAARPVGVDIHPGPLVDVVGDVHELAAFVRPGSVAGVLSAAVLEHLEAPWLVAAEVNRVLCPGGVAYHAAPTAWPEHAMPNDFWRFTTEGLVALFGPHTGFEVLAAEATGPAAIVPDPSHRRENSELPVHPASTFGHVLVRKVRDLAPGEVVWPSRQGERAARARQYPVDGLARGR